MIPLSQESAVEAGVVVVYVDVLGIRFVGVPLVLPLHVAVFVLARKGSVFEDRVAVLYVAFLHHQLLLLSLTGLAIHNIQLR